MPQTDDIEEIRNALLAVRLQLESLLAHDHSWRALRAAGLGSIVAEHLGSDADEDNKRLHRKLLRNSRAYRAYTRLIEAARILSEASGASPVAASALAAKPRIKVKAVSLVMPGAPHPCM